MAELTASNEALRAELEQLKRGGTRQAAPFSKGTRVAEPESPGRQPGAGPSRDREALPPEAITEPPVDVKGTLDACPVCGGPLAVVRTLAKNAFDALVDGLYYVFRCPHIQAAPH